MSSILSEKDLVKILERYKNRINEFGVSFDSMKSGSIEKQLIRHKIHANSLKTENPKILDIGCGLGQFYIYLQEQNINCIYTGYDIVNEYINKCIKDYPNSTFYNRNIFENGIDKEYDNIIMSQVLNNKYSHSDNMQVMIETMKMAYEHSKIAVSIDMMSNYVDYKSEELYYYSPEVIFMEAKKITKRVILRHDYRPFEFCIQLYHNNVEGYVE
jgi:SAM-dependent methyltransferase